MNTKIVIYKREVRIPSPDSCFGCLVYTGDVVISDIQSFVVQLTVAL